MSYNIYNKATDSLEQIAGGADNRQIASVSAKVDEVRADVPFKFGIDENGNYGYIKDGADSVTPFRKPYGYYFCITCGTSQGLHLSNSQNYGDSYFEVIEPSGSNAYNPCDYQINVLKDIPHARLVFSANGKSRNNVARRVFKINNQTIFDKTISDNDFSTQYPSNLIWEGSLNEGDTIFVACYYYSTAMKNIGLFIEID